MTEYKIIFNIKTQAKLIVEADSEDEAWKIAENLVGSDRLEADEGDVEIFVTEDNSSIEDIEKITSLS